MKKWWIGYTVNGRVEEVEVVGTRNTGTEWEAPVVRLADGTIKDANRGTLYDTEAEARRARVLSEAEDLEELADRHESQRVDAEKLAQGHMDDAEWNRAQAAALRARAKALRDSLEGVMS